MASKYYTFLSKKGATLTTRRLEEECVENLILSGKVNRSERIENGLVLVCEYKDLFGRELPTTEADDYHLSKPLENFADEERAMGMFDDKDPCDRDLYPEDNISNEEFEQGRREDGFPEETIYDDNF